MVNMGKLMEDPIWDVFAETEKLPRYFSGSPVAVGGWSHQQLLKNQLWTEPDFSSPPKWRGRSNQGTFFVGFVQMLGFSGQRESLIQKSLRFFPSGDANEAAGGDARGGGTKVYLVLGSWFVTVWGGVLRVEPLESFKNRKTWWSSNVAKGRRFFSRWQKDHFVKTIFSCTNRAGDILLSIWMSMTISEIEQWSNPMAPYGLTRGWTTELENKHFQ